MLVWSQALLMKLFGMGELAVRLPSALSALVICLSLFFMIRHHLKSEWPAIIAVLTFVSANAIVELHGIRYGDTDTLLSMFIFLMLMNYYRFLASGKIRYFYYTFLFFSAAVLTKSAVVFMFIPGLMVYTFWKGEFSKTIRSKHFYFAVLVSVSIIGAYYFAREIKLPGYLSSVWENELFGRFFAVKEGHKENFEYYLKGFIHGRYFFWWLLPFSLLTFFSNDSKLKNITLFLVITTVGYLLIISSSKTKLGWYDIPLYPLFATLNGITLYWLVGVILKFAPVQKPFITNIVYLAIILGLFYLPITRNISITFNPKEKPWDDDFYSISYYLRDKLSNNPQLQNCYVLKPEDQGLSAGIPFHHSHIAFYVNSLKKKGSIIQLIPKECSNVGNIVVTHSAPCKHYLEQNFVLDTIDSYKNVTVYFLIDRKIH
ncbi:MAG: ArnT family glycosyltransferase [Draconibacterium sp.]